MTTPAEIRVLHFPVDGAPRLTRLVPTAEAFQELVGGFFELIATPDGAGLLLDNEEAAIFYADQPNVHANRYLTSRYSMRAKLLGPVALVGPADANGRSTDVPDELVDAAEAAGYAVRESP